MTEETDTRVGMLRAFLAEHDEPCPGCGYNLRGLTGEACPECGEELRLRVGMVEPRLGLFVAGLIGLAAGAGFNGLMLMLFATAIFTAGTLSRRDSAVLALLACGFVAGVVVIVAWVRYRSWVRHRSKRGRVGLAWACWGLPLGTFVAFVAIIYG